MRRGITIAPLAIVLLLGSFFLPGLTLGRGSRYGIEAARPARQLGRLALARDARSPAEPQWGQWGISGGVDYEGFDQTR